MIDQEMKSRWIGISLLLGMIVVGFLLSGVVPWCQERTCQDAQKENTLQNDVVLSIAQYDAITRQLVYLKRNPKGQDENIEKLEVKRAALAIRIRSVLKNIQPKRWPNGADRFRSAL